MYTNPIIKGFNPDPSICFKDGKYYIAVSTFEYFPGVTIYESTDLVNWSYASSALSTEDILNLKGARNSVGGIYAATIRVHNGRFYIITTNKNIGWNFIAYSDSVRGPWTGPIPVRKNGIDPSLFFDDDGSCFYTSNGVIDGVRGILGAYINPDNGEFLTEPKIMTEGVSKHSTEAPHIYKKDGWYYLIFAEGGTGMRHHQEAMRSLSLDGPWEYRGKPILSHTERKDYIIQATGHADLIMTENGRWIAVFLGIRKANKPELHQLGRETFMAPVTWIDGWPVIGDDGFVDVMQSYPEAEQHQSKRLFADFSEDMSSFPFLKLRVPNSEKYIQDRDKRILHLTSSSDMNEDKGTPTLLLLRQTDFASSFKAKLDTASFSGKCGIAAWYSDKYHYRISVSHRDDAELMVSSELMVHGFKAPLKSIVIRNKSILELEIRTTQDSYSFYADGIDLGTASYAGLCTEAMMEMTFTGTLFGIWSENGEAFFLNGIEVRSLE